MAERDSIGARFEPLAEQLQILLKYEVAIDQEVGKLFVPTFCC